MHYTQLLGSTLDRKMKFYLLATYLIASTIVQAQSIEGTWRISHAQTIDSSALLVGIDTTSTDEYYETPAFITYHKLNGLLEISEKDITTHSFVKEPVSVKLKTKKGNSEFKANGLSVLINDHSPDSLVLRVKKEPNEIMILYSFENSSGKIQLENFANSDWITSSEYEFFNNWTFHFLDSGQVNLVIQGEHFGTTSFGTYKVRKSNDFHCLQITDRHQLLDDFIFYLKFREDNKLSFVIDHQDLEHPKQSEVILTKGKRITNSQRKGIHECLIGKWSFEMFASSIENTMVDSLLDLNYSIELLSDSTYIINNQVEYIYFESDAISRYEQNQSGTWKLSATGDFITLTPSETPRRQKNLTIYDLRDQKLTLDLSYPYDKYSSIQSRMKLKKDPNKL